MGYFNIIKLNATTSTNEYLKDKRAKGDCRDGDLVWTKNQTAGRGRLNKTWESEPHKNIAMSVYRDYDENPPQFPYLISVAFSVAILRGLDRLGVPELKIKWPNDILSCNKKIGGILIENRVSKGVVKDSVIGFGLNVNQKQFENLDHAASLHTVTQKKWEIDLVLQSLCVFFKEALYLDFNKNNASLLASFNSFLWQRNLQSMFEGTEGFFKGLPLEVNHEGQLKIINLETDRVSLLDFSESKMLYV